MIFRGGLKFFFLWFIILVGNYSFIFCLLLASSSSSSSSLDGPTPTIKMHHINNNKIYIPSIIWKTSEQKLSEVHHIFLNNFNETLKNNPHFVIVYSSNEDRLDFIQKHFPKYQDLYLSIIPGAYRSDLFRILVLYKYGGIYADMAMKFLCPIDTFLDRHHDEAQIVVDLLPSDLINGYIAVYPRHPLIAQAIVDIIDNVHKQRYNCMGLDITGPKTFGKF